MHVEAKDFAKAARRRSLPGPQLVEHVKQMPGIESASLSGWGLFEGWGETKACGFPDGPPIAMILVSARLAALCRDDAHRPAGGRDLEWRDAQPESPSAVIVNQSFAQRYFPGESPLGKRFSRVDGRALVAQEIVGIARDARYTSIRGTTPPTVYDPFRPANRLLANQDTVQVVR